MEISSLSDLEYVQIVANYNNVGQVDQEQVLRDRGYNDQQIKFALRDRESVSFKSLNISFHTNTNHKYSRFSYILSAFNCYKKGTMPYPGSFSEQPAKIIEIFNTLQQLEFEAREAAQKAANKKRKNG